MDILNVSDRYGPFPDMEFFVTSGDFQQINELSEDNTTYPAFSASGSKRFYDLVLPEVVNTQLIRYEPKRVYTSSCLTPASWLQTNLSKKF